MHRPSRARSVVVALGLALAVPLGLGAGLPAAGQTPTADPYGSTIPPTAPPIDPTCVLDGTEVGAGATLTGTVAGLEAGAEVEMLLGALDLETVIADADGNADFSIVLPEAIDASLVAVGVTFTVECGEGIDVDLDGEVDVLGAAADRPGADGTGGSGGGPGAEVQGADVSRAGGDVTAGSSRSSASGSGALARTGAVVVPLLACGLVALVVGAALRRRGRARVAA